MYRDVQQRLTKLVPRQENYLLKCLPLLSIGTQQLNVCCYLCANIRPTGRKHAQRQGQQPIHKII